MNIHVLGTGPSLKRTISLIKSEDITIGVNDIYKFFSVDHVLVIDPPEVFNSERLEIIKNCRPGFFHSQHEWYKIYQSERFVKFPVETRRMISVFDNRIGIPSGYDSPYSAVGLAYRLKAKKIIIHGVDIVGHKNLEPILLQVMQSYSELAQYLNGKEIQVCCADRNVPLASVLPGI